MKNWHKIPIILIVFIVTLSVTILLFYQPSKPSSLISFNQVLINKQFAPKISATFPAHNTNNSLSCLGCHGIDIDIVEKRPRLEKSFNKKIPVIPHEHKVDINSDGVNDLDCFSCHKIY